MNEHSKNPAPINASPLEEGRRSRLAVVAAAACWLAMTGAHAQSSGVTIYGTIDLGVTRVSNIGGSGMSRLDDSISQGNRLGFRGREDLGDGLEAFFGLEQGYAADTGALRQGGLGFGRLAIVGLSHRSWGEVSLGRQFDQMTGALLRFHPAGYAGIYAAAPGDADRVSGSWLNNGITYKSPVFNGFKFNAQYSLKEDGTSSTNAGRAFSSGATYAGGNFNAGIAVTDIDGYRVTPGSSLGLSQFLGEPVTTSTAIVLPKYRAAGVGAGYTMGTLTVGGLVTSTRFENAAGVSNRMTSFAVPVVYRPSEQWMLEAGFAQSKFESSRWRNFSLIADYYLSKRTDVYVSANMQRTQNAFATLVTLSSSSSEQQTAVRAGMRHRF